jgi:hypothetical protein
MRIGQAFLVVLLASSFAGKLTLAADFPRAFHVAGLPDVKRGQRVDISFAADHVVFERAGTSHLVPFTLVKTVLLLRAERNYEKSTITAAALTGALGVPFGALMILQKHKVDTVIVDYQNERSGRMGLVVQLERGKGQEIGSMFIKHGIAVVDPPPDPPKKKSKTSANSREARL